MEGHPFVFELWIPGLIIFAFGVIVLLYSLIAAMRKWQAYYTHSLRGLFRSAGGLEILDAYNEFVRMDGSTESLFHKYAMGDVICEYQLLPRYATSEQI